MSSSRDGLATATWILPELVVAGDALRAEGYPVIDEAHLTPAQDDHINFYGTYSFDVETELCREGHRPLRSPAA
ncbi:MAG TPA: hypothetical protein VHT52_03405 [Stellaceae bacterium]|nr:hypothetical protein [Stellaceae bacterium]